jgi:hypothetical protein
MKAVIPEEEQEELPAGFSVVGHVGLYSSIFFPFSWTKYESPSESAKPVSSI